MKRSFFLFILFSLWLSAEQQNLRFDAASLKPAVRKAAASGGYAQQVAMAMSQLHMRGVADRKIPRPDPGRVEIRSMSLVEIVAMAYRVSTLQVRGPGWMEDDCYEVSAIVPATNRNEADVRLMLQSLLKERFGIEAHHEMKDLSGYALLADKGGARLQHSSDQPSDSTVPGGTVEARRAGIAQELERNAKAAGKNAVLSFRRITAGTFAARLGQLLQAPVQDATGIEGLYDFTLYSTYDRLAESPRDALGEAIAPLGLKLSSQRVPTDTLVIDKVERKPVSN